MNWRRRKPIVCHDVEPRVMSLLCELCGDTTVLETNLIVLEAQVIVFIDAHSAHEGHGPVRVVVCRRAPAAARS